MIWTMKMCNVMIGDDDDDDDDDNSPSLLKEKSRCGLRILQAISMP
jgi:hypothetical protein